jgi:hypothetical protein
MSIVELLVSMALGLSVIAMGLSSTDAIRKVYSHDIARTRLQQDLRAALEVIGTNIRQAGEGFTNTFPAIEVIDGSSGAPDQLILRKEILAEEPSICVAIAIGGVRGNVFFSNATPTTGCSFGGNTANYNAWQAYRLAEGGTAKAYAFNTSTRLGEFFTFGSESGSGSSYRLVASGGTWQYSYPVGSSQLYILEQWAFSLVGDELTLIENGNTADPWEVAFGLTNLQVVIHMVDGTEKTSFGIADDWTQIESIEVTVAGEQSFRGVPMQASLSSRFFPRNILSN